MAKTKNADSGCFNGILRRLLCQGSLQTHPSDEIIPEPKKKLPPPPPPELFFNEESKKPDQAAKFEASGAPPGLVARLMGLDSLPESKWIPKAKARESITRSRSVNFMEYLLLEQVDDVAAQEQQQREEAHQHRRVRTSLSFREVPTMLQQQQNQDLYVLYLDEEDEKRMGSKVRKGNASSADLDLGDLLKQKQKEEKSKNKNNNKKKENNNQQGNNRKEVSKFIYEPRRVSVNRSERSKNCKAAAAAMDFGVALPGNNSKNGNKESEVALRKKKKKKNPVKIIRGKSKNQLSVEPVKPAECISEYSSPISVLDVNEFSISDDTPPSG